jgi:hypothetical protein
MGEVRNEDKILGGIPEGKRSRGGPRCRWENCIKMYLKGIRCDDVEWIHLA